MKCPHCNGEIFPGQFLCDHCQKVVGEVKEEKKEVKENKDGK